MSALARTFHRNCSMGAVGLLRRVSPRCSPFSRGLLKMQHEHSEYYMTCQNFINE